MPIKLGQKVRDSISGFEGIVFGRSEFLYGCVRVGIAPNRTHEGKPIETQWFDEPQVEVVEDTPAKQADPSGGPMSAPTRNANPTR